MRKNKKVSKIIEVWNEKVAASDIAQPFVCTIEFNIGRNGSSPLFFDSWLTYYTAVHVLKDTFFNLSQDFDVLEKIKIPLKKDEEFGFYFSGWFHDTPNSVVFAIKKTEHPILNIIKQRRVQINGGIMKNFKKYCMHSKQKTFKIAGVGNVELIKQILGDCYNIGKRTSCGFGEASVSIKKVDKFSLYNKGYIRPIPIKYAQKRQLPKSKVISTMIAPPYFGSNTKILDCYI